MATARTPIDLTRVLADSIDTLDDLLVSFNGRLYVLTPYRPEGRIPPVRKRVRRGDRGGLYYTNADGQRVYLKPYQQRQCRYGELAGYYGGGICRGGRRSPAKTRYLRQLYPSHRRSPLSAAASALADQRRPYVIIDNTE